MLFAWMSRLDSSFPVVGPSSNEPLPPLASSTPQFVTPVTVLPSMERSPIVLLKFPQHAARTKIPPPTAPSMVFERIPMFRATLFCECWIGSRDGDRSEEHTSELQSPCN